MLAEKETPPAGTEGENEDTRPDYSEARDFLQRLDPAAEQICFQTFDDDKGPDDEVDDLVDRYRPSDGVSPDWLVKLNQAYAWIDANGAIYRLHHGDFINPTAFRTAHDNQTVSVKGRRDSRNVGVGTLWLKDPKRRQHDRLVIRPAEGLVTHDNCLNEYRGPAVAPRQGDIGPFLLLGKRLIPSRNPFFHVLGWMAHLIRHPDVKMHTSLVVWSHEEGPGKNLFFECLVRIIGPTHATVIGQPELSSSFNGWANRKVLVIGDEVSGFDRRQDTGKLKGLITGTTIYINEKYQPAREVQNLLIFVFLSNHHDALFLNDHDRRYWVWEVTAPRLPQAEAEAFVHWRDDGGLAALHHALLHYDISDFDPKAPAPMTDAKMQMVQDNRSDVEAWVADLMVSDVATLIGREVATATELARRYAAETGHREPSAKTIVGACKRNGAYARDSQVRLKNGKKARVLALARPVYWKAQPEPAWSEEMNRAFKVG